MKKYDVIVIGSGCGALIADEAAGHGFKAALVDKGPLIGGTCVNWGCIPSKMLIYPADRIVEIQEAKKLGIEADIKNIDFPSIMERMRESRQDSQGHIRDSIKQTENLAFFEGEAHFTGVPSAPIASSSAHYPLCSLRLALPALRLALCA